MPTIFPHDGNWLVRQFVGEHAESVRTDGQRGLDPSSTTAFWALRDRKSNGLAGLFVSQWRIVHRQITSGTGARFGSRIGFGAGIRSRATRRRAANRSRAFFGLSNGCVHMIVAFAPMWG